VTGQNFVAGTVDYVAPERIAGEEGNPASDLFALGVLLYRVTEGVSPFLRDTVKTTAAAVAGYNPPAPRHAGRLAPLIMRLLDKDPANRPTAAQALALLETPPDDEQHPAKTARLIIQRLPAEPLRASPFTVFIDGVKEGEIADGTTTEFKVTPGKHTVQLTSGDYKTVKWAAFVKTSYALETRPNDGRGEQITRLRLRRRQPPSSPAARSAANSPAVKAPAVKSLAVKSPAVKTPAVSSPAAGNTTASSTAGGWFAFACLVVGVFALLYWRNVSFADYVTDTWHWSGSPWTVAAGECLHDNTQTTSSVGPMVVVPCFSAAADYTLLGTVDLNQSGGSEDCAEYFTNWPATGGMSVTGQEWNYPDMLLCAAPR
jgi:hypothetical protein